MVATGAGGRAGWGGGTESRRRALALWRRGRRDLPVDLLRPVARHAGVRRSALIARRDLEAGHLHPVIASAGGRADRVMEVAALLLALCFVLGLVLVPLGLPADAALRRLPPGGVGRPGRRDRRGRDGRSRAGRRKRDRRVRGVLRRRGAARVFAVLDAHDGAASGMGRRAGARGRRGREDRAGRRDRGRRDVRRPPRLRARMRRVGLLLAPWALCLASPARAQSAPTPARPRIGLALSGGAARGLAHIGVLRILEEAGVPVDVVAGTSMGAVVGGLYAVGYTAAQLDTIFTTQDWVALLTDPVRRRDLAVDRKLTEDQYLLTLPISRGAVHLPRSVVAGQRISQLLTGLTWSVHGVQDFRQLPIPFTAVATDLETGKAVVLDHGFLPDAIRASMAVPSVFSPVEIEDHVLIDGGVVRNLPAQDARALGADVLICSDVTDPLEPRDSLTSFADVLVQAVSFRIWDSEYEQRRHCDVLITPEVRAFSTFGFARAAELIARGEAAARAALPRIEAARAGASSPSPSGAR